jgi:hypothetical protein
MEYINKILKCPVKKTQALDLLVESNAPIAQLKEATILHNFNAYDMALTITLKGSTYPRVAKLAGDTYQQYLYIKEVLQEELFPYCMSYVCHFELHKCGEWIHLHGIFKPLMNGTKIKRSFQKIKQSIFNKIEGRKLNKYETYKHRILIEKMYQLDKWYTYISKDQTIMKAYNEHIRPLFKLNTIQSSREKLLVTF